MTKHIVVRIPPTFVYLSPYGYWAYARDFHSYADSRPPTTEFSTVPYFLYCRSIELLLKAFLLIKRVPKKDLISKRKGYSHNLHSIIRKSKELDNDNLLKLKGEDDALVDLLSDIYDGKGFEYFDVINPAQRFHKLPPLDDVRKLSDRLMKAIEPIARDAISDPQYQELFDARLDASATPSVSPTT